MSFEEDSSLKKEEWLWQPDIECELNVFGRPDKTTLVFGVFYLNRLLRDEKKMITTLFHKLKRLLDPWNKYYPWNQFKGVEIAITKMDDGLPYIFGSLCVEDNIEQEESLLVAILHEFSRSEGMDVFIKICDTEGDFVLMECNDVLPDEYESPIGNNRVWLQEGKFKIIPHTFHPERGLRSDEALNFLMNSYYACVIPASINKRLEEKVLYGFPKKNLKDLVQLPLKISNEKHMKILRNNPQLISLILKNSLDERITLEGCDSTPNCKSKEFRILTPIKHCKIISFYLNCLSTPYEKESLPSLCGQLISKSLDDLIEKRILDTLPLEWKEDVSKDSLQEELCALDLLDKPFEHEMVRMDALSKDRTSYSDIGSEEEVMSRFQKFFSEAGKLDSIDEDKINDSDSESGESEVDEEEEIRKYFERENIDIDEEDFFEFFLTEALKVKKEDLKHYQNTEPEVPVAKFDKEYDQEILEQLDEFFQSRDEDGGNEDVLELLQALSVDGSVNGPLDILMRNLRE